MKTILIVGINGFLGSHLAKSFKDNFKIIGLTSNTNNLYRIDKEEFEVFSSSDTEIANIFENNTIDIIIPMLFYRLNYLNYLNNIMSNLLLMLIHFLIIQNIHIHIYLIILCQKNIW